MTIERFLGLTIRNARTDPRAVTVEGYTHVIRRIASLLAWRNRALTAKHFEEFSTHGYAVTEFTLLEIPED